MFLINFQLWARNRKIPGGGSFNIRGGGGVIKRGKRLLELETVLCSEAKQQKLERLLEAWKVAIFFTRKTGALPKLQG